jgi:hypothetical protein
LKKSPRLIVGLLGADAFLAGTAFATTFLAGAAFATTFLAGTVFATTFLGAGAGVGDLKISPKFKEGLGAAAVFDGTAFATGLGAGTAFATGLGAGAAFFSATGLGLGGLRNEPKRPGGAFSGEVGFVGLSCFCLSSHSRALARTISAASSAIFLWSATRLASASATAVDF